jgi:hypothetical protein
MRFTPAPACCRKNADPRHKDLHTGSGVTRFRFFIAFTYRQDAETLSIFSSASPRLGGSFFPCSIRVQFMAKKSLPASFANLPG